MEMKKEKRMGTISDDDVSKIFQKRNSKMMHESLSSKFNHLRQSETKVFNLEDFE
jgi:hypothetical protein